MNSFQQGNLRRQLLRALRMMGAETFPIFREEKDPNGMPTGEKHQIGAIYGVDWRKVSASAVLTIDMPGVTIGGRSARRFTGLMMDGDAPQGGDLLALADGESRIIDAAFRMGVYDLTLGGDGA